VEEYQNEKKRPRSQSESLPPPSPKRPRSSTPTPIPIINHPQIEHAADLNKSDTQTDSEAHSSPQINGSDTPEGSANNLEGPFNVLLDAKKAEESKIQVEEPEIETDQENSSDEGDNNDGNGSVQDDRNGGCAAEQDEVHEEDGKSCMIKYSIDHQ
jgi:hypothetical protein